MLIYQALGFPTPIFGHVSLILAPDKSKLSKRHGATSVGEFREEGYLAAVSELRVGVVGRSGGAGRGSGGWCDAVVLLSATPAQTRLLYGTGAAAAAAHSEWLVEAARLVSSAAGCLPAHTCNAPLPHPQAMLNYLSLLGWNDGSEQEIYSVDELQQAFSLDRITKSAAGGQGCLRLRNPGWGVTGTHFWGLRLRDEWALHAALSFHSLPAQCSQLYHTG